jgi:tRNA (guanine-N7-)-methyltransferase
MPRNKLKKFAEIDTFQNVIYRPYSLAGNWNRTFFMNDNPITLELGCGTGIMTLELARRHADRNYIGVDNKRARVWYGAHNALEMKLTNIAFITTRVELLGNYFGHGEIGEIWITFPDPYPKPSKSNKRLISPEMVTIYRKFIKPDCIFHLKTDDKRLFDFSINTITDSGGTVHLVSEHTHDDPAVDDDVRIQTVYEKRHLDEGRAIRYVRFTVN